MKNNPTNNAVFDDYLGCFGNFSLEDHVCREHCALSLRCAIELDQNLRMEMFNDMMYSEGIALKMQ